MTIDTIFLNWNQAKLTIETVTSFQKTNFQNLKLNIIIVDNHSSDDSYQLLKKNYSDSNVIVLSTKTNLGYAGGNNFGIKWAKKNHHPDFYLISNNDIIFDKNFLINLLKPFENNCRLALTGPKIYFAPGKEYHANRYQKSDLGKVIWSAGGNFDWQNVMGSNRGVDKVDHGQYEKFIINPDFISGCCFLVSGRAIDDVGIFDPDYFMYLEDVDFCHRLQLKNWQIAYIPNSVIWHVNAGSSSVGSHLQDYFITRNRLIFGFKYTSLKTKFALFRETLRILLIGAKWQKIGVIDFYLHHYKKGSWR